MVWRSFAIRIPLILCLLFCTGAFAKKKPPATAEKILQMRKSYGAFKSVDDLLAIRGLGAKRLEKMRKYLTVGKPAPKSNALPNHIPGAHPRTNPEEALSAT